ncbi:MAG TPA: potassium channel protein [Candidatus Binataceae bacterium]|nr:potassium channel protein [Candidatus Binataceae bacterium]
MSPGQRLLMAMGLVIGLCLAGTVGYHEIERMSWLDGLYMTVVTITTVGYAEVKPLDTAGRWFTMGLIFTGVGTAYYGFAAVTEAVVGGQLRAMVGKTAMDRRIRQLRGHIIVCGYGRFGRVVVDALRQQREQPQIVLVEIDPEKEAELERTGLFYVLGSALDEDVLDHAGIRVASDIVIATSSDPDNVFISLSARELNRTIRIHARAESEVGVRHLHLAGADRAISSYQYSAVRIAAAIARPAALDFLSIIFPGGKGVSIEEVRVQEHSPLVACTIAQVEHDYPRMRIVALKRGLEEITVAPEPQTQFQSDDLVIAVGAEESLKRFAEMAA